MKLAIFSMNSIYRLRQLVLNASALLAMVVPLFFTVAALGTRFGLWGWPFGFLTLTRDIGVKLLFLLLIFSIISGFLGFFIKPRKGIFMSVLALAISLSGLGYGGMVKYKAGRLPYIHDITTDTEDVPTFSAAIVQARTADGQSNSLTYIGKTVYGSDQLVSVAQVKAYPNIRSLVRQEPPEVVFEKALRVARLMGWHIVTEDRDSFLVEASVQSFWFGFKDDVIVRIRARDGGGSIIDLRSISRVGVSDLGKNAERIRAFGLRL